MSDGTINMKCHGVSFEGRRSASGVRGFEPPLNALSLQRIQRWLEIRDSNTVFTTIDRGLNTGEDFVRVID